MDEKTYTLVNEDEVMVDFDELDNPIDVYVYADSKPSTFRWLGINPSGIGSYTGKHVGAFIHAPDVDAAWQAVQERAITLDVD